jgi:hypothetical protein
MRIQRWWRQRVALRPVEERARQRAAYEKKARKEMRSLHLLWTRQRHPFSGQRIWVNDVNGHVQFSKPRVFGEGDSPYDAPTPRTKRRIWRLASSGPTVWYPRTFARRYGVYGGRVEMDEVEAGEVLTRAAREYLERLAKKRERELLGRVSLRFTSKVVATSAIKDLMAATRKSKATTRMAARRLQFWWSVVKARRALARGGGIARVYRAGLRVREGGWRWGGGQEGAAVEGQWAPLEAQGRRESMPAAVDRVVGDARHRRASSRF